MIVIDQIESFIKDKDNKELYKYAAIYLGIFLAILLGLIYWHYRSVNKNINLLNKTNENRKDTQDLLSRYKKLKLQEEQLEEIFSENENFKIVNAYNDLVNNLDLLNYIESAPIPKESKIDENKYIERTLDIKLNGISTKQLVELLESIQDHKRLYIKKVEIIKSKTKAKAIDVSVIIAALDTIS